MKKILNMALFTFSAYLHGASSENITFTIKNSSPFEVNVSGMNIAKEGQRTRRGPVLISKGKEKIFPVIKRDEVDSLDKIIVTIVLSEGPAWVQSTAYQFSADDLEDIDGRTMNLSVTIGDPAFEKYRPSSIEQKK